MNLNELYELLKKQLKQMYNEGTDLVVLQQKEFFAVYKAICDLMKIKHITDEH
jgi:hypothetical protein